MTKEETKVLLEEDAVFLNNMFLHAESQCETSSIPVAPEMVERRKRIVSLISAALKQCEKADVQDDLMLGYQKGLEDGKRVFGNTGWQPIETAPRDGTAIFFCNAAGGRWVGQYLTCKSDATHWQPLPEPPTRKEE